MALYGLLWLSKHPCQAIADIHHALNWMDAETGFRAGNRPKFLLRGHVYPIFFQRFLTIPAMAVSEGTPLPAAISELLCCVSQCKPRKP